MGICGSSSRDTVIIPNKFNGDDENKQNPDHNLYQNNLSGNIKERKKSENDEFINKKHDKIILNIHSPNKKSDKKKLSNNINISVNSNHSNLHKMNNIDNSKLNENDNNINNLKIIIDDKKNKSVTNRNEKNINEAMKRNIKKRETNYENHKLNKMKRKLFDKSNNENIKEEKERENRFERKMKKTKTLVEKSRLEKKFQEEMKICVLNQSLIEKQKGDPSKKYKIIKKLGDGSYGTVFFVVNNQTGICAAIKKIGKIKEKVIDDLAINNEIDILKKLDHPNIVKIYEFYDTFSDYFIVTEYCKNGELYSYIKNTYSENQLAVLFYQVFSGLSYLHENHILHRDLKLENIMISEIEKDIKTKEDYFWIKIIDFGTAKIFQKNKAEKSVVGSSYYIAPEVLKKKYNEKCDTWSIGVILYMLIVGIPPFDGKNDEEIIESIKIGKYNNQHPKLLCRSKEIQNLVSCLLERKISKRLSSFEALHHPFFTKFNGRALFCNFNVNEIQSYLSNLLNYKFQSKFQQLVLAFIVHNIPHNKETKIILKLFRYFNTKGNCKLTKEELISGLYKFREKNIVDNIIDDIFLMLDGDNNGYIEYEEFLRACIDKSNALNNDNLKYAFKFLDKDNSGTLSVDKIMNAFVKKGNATLKDIFKNSIKEVDKDNDGIIDFNGFRELMRRVQ